MLATGPRYYAEQQHLTATAVRQLRRTSTVPEALRLLAVYQATAALTAVEYGTEALAEQDISDSGAEVVPEAFTVDPTAPSVLDDVESETQFALIVAGLVSDAGRSAMGAFTASRTQEDVGSIRVLTPPSCSRCAVLAGIWSSWSTAFERHPRCDCQSLPSNRRSDAFDYDLDQIGSYRKMPDGSKRFESGLTKAQRAAIDEGADISQVVNARRGMQTINFAGRRVQVTTEGTTSRGLAFKALSQRGGSVQADAGFATRITRDGPETRRVTQTRARAPRLSPEAIYRVADGDRDTAVRLLRANAYIL